MAAPPDPVDAPAGFEARLRLYPSRGRCREGWHRSKRTREMWKRCGKRVENVWIPVENITRPYPPDTRCVVFPRSPPSTGQFPNNQQTRQMSYFQYLT